MAVDVETTGLYSSDRIVEVAVVAVDVENGEVVDEFDTLVNPLRDVGPVRVHGITASMVEAAPTFEEVAAALSTRISGSLLVAHNSAFDVRMLAREYDRLGAELQPGAGICTLQLTGERLPQACQRHGVEHGEHHRALADARAAASLFLRAIDGEVDGVPASVNGLSGEMKVRTLRRPVARFVRTVAVEACGWLQPFSEFG